jgi:hypothetical protein
LAAVLSALSLVSIGPVVAQTVVDAKGKFVGSLYEYGVDTQQVLRKVSSTVWIAFPVVVEGIRYTGHPIEYLYQTADCSGVAYIDNDVNNLVQQARFIPSDQDARWGTDGLLVYGGEMRIRMAIYSARSKFNYNIGDGPCTSIPGEMRTVRMATEVSVKSLRLTAPFKLK